MTPAQRKEQLRLTRSNVHFKTKKELMEEIGRLNRWLSYMWHLPVERPKSNQRDMRRYRESQNYRVCVSKALDGERLEKYFESKELMEKAIGISKPGQAT